MFDFIIYLLIYLFLGVFPLFIFLKIKKFSTKSSVVYAVGFSPVLLVIYNTVNVLFGLQDLIFQFILPVLVSAVFLFLFIKHKDVTDQNYKKIILPIIIAVIVGIAYWYFFFASYIDSQVLYRDTIWNLGTVSELKNHFPPIDPHWYTGEYFVYHFLSDSFIAAMSNFTYLDILASMKITNILTSVSMFVIISLSLSDKSKIEKLIVLIVIVLLPFAADWIPFQAFKRQMSASAASTFFWSLPIFFTSLYAWMKYNTNRSKGKIYINVSVVFLLVFILFFAKGSFVSIFVFFEIFLFFKFLFVNKISGIRRIRDNLKSLLSFLYIPLSFFLLYLLMPGAEKISFGLEIKDTIQFGTWTPLLPFILLYLTLIVFIIISIKNTKSFKWEFLFASILNYILFLITRHPGSSDIYFVFNVILLNAFFIVYSDLKNIFIRYFGSFIISGFFVFVIIKMNVSDSFNYIGFNMKSILEKNSYGEVIYTDVGEYSDEVKEYLKISDSIPKDALITVPKKSLKFFLYSAFIGRRIWNESPVYTTNTNSHYVPIRSFQKETKFVPDYFSYNVKGSDYDSAYNEFLKTFVADTSKYEISENRYKEYSKCVFDSISKEEFENIIRKNKWTHVIVENNNLDSINYWINSQNKIKGKYITIFILPRSKSF